MAEQQLPLSNNPCSGCRVVWISCSKYVSSRLDGIAAGASRECEVVWLSGTGYEADFNTLKRLNIPAIVHLRYEGREHFSVVRGIDPATGLVWLSDPFWGNRYFSRYQFMKRWRSDDNSAGRLLLIVPGNRGVTVLSDFFQTPRARLEIAKLLLR